jgi:hypothetical protein
MTFETANLREAVAAFFEKALPAHKVLTDEEAKKMWSEDCSEGLPWENPYFTTSAADLEHDMRREVTIWHNELPIQQYQISDTAQYPIPTGRLDFDTYAKRREPLRGGAFDGSTRRIRRISVWRISSGYFSTLEPRPQPKSDGKSGKSWLAWLFRSRIASRPPSERAGGPANAGYVAGVFPKMGKISFMRDAFPDERRYSQFGEGISNIVRRYQFVNKSNGSAVIFDVLFNTGDELQSFMSQLTALLKQCASTADVINGWSTCSHGRHRYTWGNDWPETVCDECARLEITPVA